MRAKDKLRATGAFGAGKTGNPMACLALALLFASAAADFDEYIGQLKSRVELVWNYPQGSENLQAAVKFNLNHIGQVSFIKITKSSGRADFDSSVVDAVKRSSPFPRLPKQFVTAAAVREVEMVFTRQSESKAIETRQRGARAAQQPADKDQRDETPRPASRAENSSTRHTPAR